MIMFENGSSLFVKLSPGFWFIFRAQRVLYPYCFCWYF